MSSAAKRALQDARPRQVGAVDRAAERVEHQQLDARAHLVRDVLVAQRRDELRDAGGVAVVLLGGVCMGHGGVLRKKAVGAVDSSSIPWYS